MGKLLGLTGTLVLVGALGVGGWWAWPILFPSLPPGWLSTLSKADAALVQNRPDLAKAALAKIPEKLPVNGWLQWEKRVQAVAVATHGWTWAVTNARAAQAQYPGNPDLTAYLVWTLLQDGKAAEAASLAQKVLPGTSWETLAVQAAVQSAGLAGSDWTNLRETLAQPSREAYQVYQRLVGLSKEPALRKNALLAALSLGDLDAAREHLDVLTPAQREAPPFDRLQALLAYDQGDWPRAAALLKGLGATRPETLLILADVYLHLGDRAQAKVIYDQLLADHPTDLPGPLVVNRVTLALDEGDAVGALALLDRWAQSHGPSEPRMKLLELEARFRLGESASVRQKLGDILASGTEDDLVLNAELLKDRLFPELNSAPHLWSLLHRHPSFQPLAERLCWLLIQDQDYPGAMKVLDLHEASLKSEGLSTPWWASFLRALVLSLEGQLDAANLAFDQVPPAWRSAAFYADWSLTVAVLAQQAPDAQRQQLLSGALDTVTQAIELLPPATDTATLRQRSLWLTRRGELKTALSPLEPPAQRGTLRSAAAEDFHQAVQLDGDNLRASFLLRQAEVTPQEKP